MIYILPKNTGPHCNYKIVGWLAARAPSQCPSSGDAPGNRCHQGVPVLRQCCSKQKTQFLCNHRTKNHISQVLEYHRKLKNTM